MVVLGEKAADDEDDEGWWWWYWGDGELDETAVSPPAVESCIGRSLEFLPPSREWLELVTAEDPPGLLQLCKNKLMQLHASYILLIGA